MDVPVTNSRAAEVERRGQGVVGEEAVGDRRPRRRRDKKAVAEELSLGLQASLCSAIRTASILQNGMV